MRATSRSCVAAGGDQRLSENVAETCGFEFAIGLSSYSFRLGLSTSAARENLDFELIKKQGGWKNNATVREYTGESLPFADNVAAVLMKELEGLADE